MLLTDRLYQSIVETGCLPAESHGLVAVSGGADSVALLSLLHQLAERLQLTLEVAHLDHGLRAESADEGRFVSALCARLGVPLTRQHCDVAAISNRRKGNLEEVARDVRRQFLLQTAERCGCDWIALGHHADDQVETFLMNLLRGAGPGGLAGMRRVSGRIVRPLLSFSRQELLTYLGQEGLDWCEDPSNRDPALTRNRIRHELIPMLAGYNPNISSLLASCCEQLRQDEDFWRTYIAEEMGRCGRREGAAFVLDGHRLASLAPAVASRIIRAALGELRGHVRGLAKRHIDAIFELLHRGPVQGELDLPGAWVARRYGRLYLYAQRPDMPDDFHLVIAGPGRYALPDGQCLVLSLENSPQGEDLDVVEFASGDGTFPLTVRYPRPGDRIRPSGMTGTKKLQDLFVDLKLPKEARRKAPLLFNADELLWVVGLRRCEGRRPHRGEPVLRIARGPQNAS